MLDIFPEDIKNYIFQFLYDYSYEKNLVLKQLHSFRLKHLTTSNKNNIKPSQIKGNYILSYN